MGILPGYTAFFYCRMDTLVDFLNSYARQKIIYLRMMESSLSLHHTEFGKCAESRTDLLTTSGVMFGGHHPAGCVSDLTSLI